MKPGNRTLVAVLAMFGLITGIATAFVFLNRVDGNQWCQLEAWLVPWAGSIIAVKHSVENAASALRSHLVESPK